MSAWEHLPVSTVAERVRASAQLADAQEYELWSVPSFDQKAPEYVKGHEIGSAKQSVTAGDVLLCKINPRINRVWLVTGESDLPKVASTEWLAYRSNNPLRLLPEYLLWYLRSPDVRGKLCADVTGATGSHTRAQAALVDSYPIPLPPLAEQKRIVGILDEAFEEIAKITANAKRNLANARQVLPALLDELLSNVVGARLLDLEQVVEDDCPLSYGIVQPGDEVECGLPIVRPVDLGAREVGLNGLKRIDAALAAGYQRTTLRGRDLLLCVRGTTGVVSQASSELMGANVTRGIVPIRFKSDLLCQELGYFVLLSQGVQRQIRAATYGAALMQINIRDVRKIKVAVPPVERQQELLQQLEQIANDSVLLLANYARQLELQSELKSSVLQKAFSGKLTGEEAIAA